jgi:hypothetical protein
MSEPTKVEWFKAYIAHSRQSQVCEMQSAHSYTFTEKVLLVVMLYTVKRPAANAAFTAPYVGVYPGSRRAAKQKDRFARTEKPASSGDVYVTTRGNHSPANQVEF